MLIPGLVQVVVLRSKWFLAFFRVSIQICVQGCLHGNRTFVGKKFILVKPKALSIGFDDVFKWQLIEAIITEVWISWKETFQLPVVRAKVVDRLTSSYFFTASSTSFSASSSTTLLRRSTLRASSSSYSAASPSSRSGCSAMASSAVMLPSTR